MAQIANAFEGLVPQNGAAYAYDRALAVLACSYFCGLEQWMVKQLFASDYDAETGVLTAQGRREVLKFRLPEFVRPAFSRISRRRRGRLIAACDWNTALNLASRSLGCGTYELCSMARRGGITHAAALNGIEAACVLGRCSRQRLTQLIDWTQVPATSPAFVIDCEQVVLHPRQWLCHDEKVTL